MPERILDCLKEAAVYALAFAWILVSWPAGIMLSMKGGRA
jgi:hypothetical protein